jgi:predicted nuclease of restriction endonuclease-like (RecB) superfamily
MKTDQSSDRRDIVAGAKSQSSTLFERVASILDRARANVVRSVNNQMLIAYWLIGREIVQELQSGDKRAEYGKKVLDELSSRLTERYGKGFSVTNLRYFRLFYQTYAERVPEIHHTPCDVLESLDWDRQIHHTPCDEFEILNCSVENRVETRGFSPVLSWSHYRTLTKVENENERLFYELEAEKEGWSVLDLKRQISTFLFARLLKSRDKEGLMELTRQGNSPKAPVDTIKDPYILDFLALPDSPVLHESNLEKAIISNLQSFLLELGKGFAFVSRQKRLQFEDDFFYIDLVFYHWSSVKAFFPSSVTLF